MLVSPVNAKPRLVELVDSALADADILAAIIRKQHEGVDVRVVKSILVDGARAHMGSENLTTTSLTKNREIGLVVTDDGSLRTMESTFEADFTSAQQF